MRMNLRKLSSAAAITLVCGLPAAAQADISDRFTFSGFASFIAAKSLEKDEPYGDATAKVPHATELRDYSKLGLRVSVDLLDNLTFTTQMLADGSNEFEPEFDWIFLSYNITPDLVLHAGKYVTNYFMYSDYADISYAYHWVEAPDAVYGTNLNKTLEGAKLVWNSRMGAGWTSELSLSVGKDEVDMSKVGVEGATLKMGRAIGFAWQVDHEWLSLRASYMSSKTSANLERTQLDISGILSGAAAQAQSAIDAGFGTPELQVLAGVGNTNLLNDASLNRALAWRSADAQFIGLGGSLNFDYVFAVAEVTYANMEDTIAIGDQTSGYLTIGTHLPKSTSIAVTIYEKRNDVNKSIERKLEQGTATAVANESDPSKIPAIYAASGIVNAVLLQTQKRKRDGITVSGRWDFHSNASLKAEYNYEWQTHNPQGKKEKFTPNVVRLGIDLVF